MKTLFTSSASDNWSTPQSLFDRVTKEIGPFYLDVCASPENAKCSRFFSEQEDGLKQVWSGRCWMNPPYGRKIVSWVRKAYESSLSGAEVVCLLPARTETAWWHDYVMRGRIEFLRGRLKFSGHKHNAPFPSALVTFSKS